MSTWYFAAYDHGAKNQIRPLYRRALAAGHGARWEDLEQSAGGGAGAFVGDASPEVLVVGCSGNQREWSLIGEARRLGAVTAMYIEIGIGPRLDGLDPGACPDIFLVTNPACARELVAWGAPPERIRIVGSCHLEALAEYSGFADAAAVRDGLGIDGVNPLLSFFCSKEIASAPALELLLGLLGRAGEAWDIAVRLHPRMRAEYVEELVAACEHQPGIRFDREGVIDTPSLLLHSAASISTGSTVAAESLVVGTPAAFFQVGWDYRVCEELFGNLGAVRRLRDEAACLEFLAEARAGRSDQGAHRGVEQWEGALDRGWQEINAALKGI